jgi:hypothetical protein
LRVSRGLLPPYTRACREILEPGNEELGWLVRFANPRNTRKDRRRGASLMSDTDTRRGESSWTAAAFWSTCWIVKSADALYLLAAIQTALRAIDAETAAAKVLRRGRQFPCGQWRRPRSRWLIKLSARGSAGPRSPGLQIPRPLPRLVTRAEMRGGQSRASGDEIC